MSNENEMAALARLKEAEERVRNLQPRCLGPFLVRAAELPGFRFDGHGEPLNKIFHLCCPCGSNQFVALGHHLINRGKPIFVSPLALRCSGCEKVEELFDSKIHGYDAELGHVSATIRGQGQREPFACPTCGIEPMVCYARFEHSSEVLSDSTGLFAGREQDLFTWFSLVGRCAGCHNLRNVADFECA